MATLTTARRGSSGHMGAFPWEILEPAEREGVLGGPIDEEELVVITKDQLLLEEKIIQVPMKHLEYGTTVKQRIQQTKRKEKLVPKGPKFEIPSVKHTSSLIRMKETDKRIPEVRGAMSGVNPSAKRKMIRGNFKCKPACSTQPSKMIVERESYTVKMDEVEYESLEVFKSHTCKPKCNKYYVCETRALAVLLHFKKFMKSIFGRESEKMVKDLRIEYVYFTCFLTDEEAKILEGKQGVVKVELEEDLGGTYH